MGTGNRMGPGTGWGQVCDQDRDGMGREWDRDGDGVGWGQRLGWAGAGAWDQDGLGWGCDRDRDGTGWGANGPGDARRVPLGSHQCSQYRAPVPRPPTSMGCPRPPPPRSNGPPRLPLVIGRVGSVGVTQLFPAADQLTLGDSDGRRRRPMTARRAERRSRAARPPFCEHGAADRAQVGAGLRRHRHRHREGAAGLGGDRGGGRRSGRAQRPRPGPGPAEVMAEGGGLV